MLFGVVVEEIDEDAMLRELENQTRINRLITSINKKRKQAERDRKTNTEIIHTVTYEIDKALKKMKRPKYIKDPKKRGAETRRIYRLEEYNPDDERYTLVSANGVPISFRRSFCPRKNPCNPCKAFATGQHKNSGNFSACGFRQFRGVKGPWGGYKRR